MHIIGFSIYNRKIFTGVIQPIKATLALWAFIATLNALSFSDLSQDFTKAFISIIASVACILTFLFAWRTAKLEPMSKTEKKVFAFGILAVLVWTIWKQSSYANVVLQFAVLLSFLPLYKNLWMHPTSEHWLPWIFWVSAYVCLFTSIMLDWTNPWELVYPITNFVLHGIVILLTLRKPSSNSFVTHEACS